MNRSPFSDAPKGVRYEHRGLTVDAPVEWSEDSVLYLEAPGPRPRPSISVCRVTALPEETLETFMSRRVAELAALLKVAVDETRETVVCGMRAILVVLGWEELDGRMTQRMIVFPGPPGAMYVISGIARASQQTVLGPVFERVLASVRFTVPSSGPSIVPPSPPSKR